MYLDAKNNIFTNKVLRGQKGTIQVREIYFKLKVYKASVFIVFRVWKSPNKPRLMYLEISQHQGKYV